MAYYQNGFQVIMEGQPDAEVCTAVSPNVAAGIVEALNIRLDVAKGDAPNAPSATQSGTLLDAVADVIAKKYIGVSSSRMKAAQCAESVLETVMEFYAKMESSDAPSS